MRSILIETENEAELEMVEAFIKEHKLKGFIVKESKAGQENTLDDLIRMLIPLA